MHEPSLPPLEEIVRELGNIGAGHAATALATLFRRRIAMDVPAVAALPLDAWQHFFPFDAPVMAVCMPVSVAETTPQALLGFFLQEASGLDLLSQLLGKAVDLPLAEEARSALAELGNIVLNAFLTVIGDTTQLRLQGSPPLTASDMLGAIVQEALALLEPSENTVLVMRTRFWIQQAEQTFGGLLFLPDKATLGALQAYARRTIV